MSCNSGKLKHTINEIAHGMAYLCVTMIQISEMNTLGHAHHSNISLFGIAVHGN